MDRPTGPAAPVILVMGVSGCGKTTIGTLLAERTGWTFLDSDLVHPPANVAKMRAGVALTDDDRWPWLREVAAWIARRHAAGGGAVVACSALKRAYRDVLRTGDPELLIVHLRGGVSLLRDRLANRHGHFFPEALLGAQLDDLEEPDPDEHAVTVPIGQSPDVTAATALGALGLDGGR